MCYNALAACTHTSNCSTALGRLQIVFNEQIMARICCEAENSLNNDALYQAVRNTVIAEQVQFQPLQLHLLEQVITK
jgi:hypothetical protein